MERRTKKVFFLLNVLLFICAMTCLVCYDIFDGLWLKGFTSFWFVVLGRVNLLYTRKMHLRFSVSNDFTRKIFGLRFPL